MFLQQLCGLIDDIVEGVAAFAQVKQELDALIRYYHACDAAREMLNRVLRCIRLLSLLIFLYLADNVLVEVVAEILLFLAVFFELVELVHGDVDQDRIHELWCRWAWSKVGFGGVLILLLVFLIKLNVRLNGFE